MSRASRHALLVVAAGTAAGLVLVLLAALGGELSGEGPRYLMAEAQDVLGGPWYAGAVSVLGGLLWWTAAPAAALNALADPARRPAHVLALAFTASVALDDVLRLHDEAYPALGVPERGAVLGYLLLLGAWLLALRPRGTALLAPAAVLAALGTSVLADQVLQQLLGEEVTLLEDGAKLVGAGVWAALHVTTTAGLLRGVTRDHAQRHLPARSADRPDRSGAA